MIWKDACPICSLPEEPRVGQSYPNFYAAKLASKFVKVVLSAAVVMNCSVAIHGAITEPPIVLILKNILMITTLIGETRVEYRTEEAICPDMG